MPPQSSPCSPETAWFDLDGIIPNNLVQTVELRSICHLYKMKQKKKKLNRNPEPKMFLSLSVCRKCRISFCFELWSNHIAKAVPCSTSSINNWAALLHRWGKMFFFILCGLFRSLYPVSLKIKQQTQASCKDNNYESQCEMQNSAFGKRKVSCGLGNAWCCGENKKPQIWGLKPQMVLKQVEKYMHT